MMVTLILMPETRKCDGSSSALWDFLLLICQHWSRNRENVLKRNYWTFKQQNLVLSVMDFSNCNTGQVHFSLKTSQTLLWCSTLNNHLQCQHPTWVWIWVLLATLLIQLPTKIPGKAGNYGSGPWDTAIMCETYIKLLAPGYSLTQPQPLWSFGE